MTNLTSWPWLFFVLGISAVSGLSKPIFRKCSSGNSGVVEVLDVQLPNSGCRAPPCFLQQGVPHLARFTFRFNKRFTNLKIVFSGLLHNIPAPIHFKTIENTCNGGHLNVSCPLEENQVVEWSGTIDFPSGIAGVKCFAQMELKEVAASGEEKQHLCFTIPLSITV